MSRYPSGSRYSRYESAWPAYVPVAERRAKAEKEAAKLAAKSGTALSPVRLTGTKIASTFWGKSWCTNLESYRDYENRLPRGRSYVRNGSVIDLQLAVNNVTAKVSGSSVYTVKIDIVALPAAQWQAICRDCAGGIDSLVELLQGRFSKGAMERLCRQETGLFPKPSEIRLHCSCPDSASMCKHIAAVLYGVGARLDTKPELLFRLRGVDERDLVANIGANLPLGDKAPSANVLEAGDMAALFGLDMAEPDEATPLASKPAAGPEAKPGAKPAAVAVQPATAAASHPAARASKTPEGKPAARKQAAGGAASGVKRAGPAAARAASRTKPASAAVKPSAEPVAWWLATPNAKPAKAAKPAVQTPNANAARPAAPVAMLGGKSARAVVNETAKQENSVPTSAGRKPAARAAKPTATRQATTKLNAAKSTKTSGKGTPTSKRTASSSGRAVSGQR